MTFKVFPVGDEVRVSPLEQAIGPVLEVLEKRLMFSTHRHSTTVITGELSGGTLRADTGLNGISVARIQHLYGVDQLTANPAYPLFENLGESQLLTIIGPAAGDPGAALTIFDNGEKVPGPDGFAIDPVGTVDQTGTEDPFGAANSMAEIEWAHAMAPHAEILFVEVPSQNGVVSVGNLQLGIQEAVKDMEQGGLGTQPGPLDQFGPGGVMDIGLTTTGEDPTTDAQYDALFSYKYAYNISFIAPTADYGGAISMPATSPWVTSVGGTVYSIDGTGNRIYETASLNSGGGESGFESLPAFQKGITVGGKALRTRGTPDLALASQTLGLGVAAVDEVFDPVAGTFSPAFWDVEGTSVSAAIFTGMVADTNELRESLGLGVIGRDLNNELYALYKQSPTTYFTDITQSNNTLFQAMPGYDLATGMGAPIANNLILGLGGVQPSARLSVTSVGDLYQSLDTALTGNAITVFSGKGTSTIDSQFLTLNLNFLSTTTIDVGGTETTLTTSATMNFAIIGRNGNSFSADGTATVVLPPPSTGGTSTVVTFQIAVTGRISGAAGHQKISGQFFTINTRDKKILPGAIPVFQGTFSS